MKRFLRNLKDQLHFLDEKEQERVVLEYQKKIEELMDHGKSEKEALKSIGSVNKIIRKVCRDRNLDYDFCVRNNAFEKDINNVSKLVANFFRDIIKIFRKVKLNMNLEGFLEAAIKLVVLILLFMLLKVPFMLVEGFAKIVNHFIFYPFNTTFDFAVNCVVGLAYLVFAIIITLKVFGSYHPRERKIVKEEEIDKVDKEYSWLEIFIRALIYIIILIPLILLMIVDLFLLVESSYLVARGIDLIGIPIILAGFFGLLCALIGTIKDSLNHRKRSYLSSK